VSVRRTIGLRIAGRVQGVGFCWFVRDLVRRHAIEGEVRNLADGRVEVRARGGAHEIESLVDAVRRGPAGARVTAVEAFAADEEWTFDGFEIRH
jgi:acylphosphatase